MGGILLLSGFEVCGVAVCARLCRRGAAVRMWLGLCLGLLMMMWFPCLFAFAMDFTLAAQLCGLGLAALCAAGTYLFSRRRGLARTGAAEREIPWGLLLALVLPLFLLGTYLECTHTIRAAADGSLHVGQSTYGDLCLHLGIAEGMCDASFPPVYTLIQGVDLGYPFLSDALAASMLLAGSTLRTAFVFSGSLMLLLVYAGYALFAWELTHSRMAVALGYVLLFLNGGLGFLYVMDGAASDPAMLREVFTGYYRAPANRPDLNLRWVNVICDMLIPQRTLLAGWMALMPALFLLLRAVRENRAGLFAALGLWAGAMPMVHTHSFLALGLISAGVMISVVARAETGQRAARARNFLLYALIAVALAAPQLLKWSFPQTVEGGSLRIRLNWVNNNGDNTFIDGYFWFWIKNVGVAYLLLVPAALSAGKTGRALSLGALLVYAAAELIQFQPNPYDNNKLFYVAYIAMTPLLGAFLVKIWDRTKGLRCRGLFLAAFLVVSTLSGGLSLVRETISDYRLFSPDMARAGEFVRDETEKDAVFLTGNEHNNPVTALAGRQIVCGTGSYLYYHGISYRQQQIDEKRMLEAPGENLALLEDYGVDYVFVSSYERNTFAVDEAFFAENCETVFKSGDVSIYKFTNARYTVEEIKSEE